MSEKIEIQLFLEIVRPALISGDLQQLKNRIANRWQAKQLHELLRHGDVEIRSLAAICLGMVGGLESVSVLVLGLQDNSSIVNQASEQSLYAIWINDCDKHVSLHFRQAMSMIEKGANLQACSVLQGITRESPDFAQAHYQWATALIATEKYKIALQRAYTAVKLSPTHFPAIVAMGHCYVHLGDFEMALRCYRRARRIHPNLEDINETIEHLNLQLAGDPMGASGIYHVDHLYQEAI